MFTDFTISSLRFHKRELCFNQKIRESQTMTGGKRMFAEKIRELRQSRNLSEAALDEIFGLMRGTVANWEHGFSVPDEELIDDIADYFKVKRSELVGA
jgi:ribosome-binding protein aMBF1 (putative translation factor)